MDVYRWHHEGNGPERNDSSLRLRDEGGLESVWQRIELVSDLLFDSVRYIHCSISDAPDKVASVVMVAICRDWVGNPDLIVSFS